jgi:hypothetical protein
MPDNFVQSNFLQCGIALRKLKKPIVFPKLDKKISKVVLISADGVYILYCRILT